MSVLERFARYNHSTRERSRRDRLQVKPKLLPIRASDDGQKLLFDRPREIIINRSSGPTIRYFSFDGAGSLPFSSKSQSPREQSRESLVSDSASSFTLSWTKAELLSLSDSVRACIKHDKRLGSAGDELSTFLENTLRDERRRQTLDFETIEHARLDKLLNDIIQFSTMANMTKFSTDLTSRFRVDAANAKELRKIWRQRFREQFFMIDQMRYAVLVRGGRLKDVSFNCALTYDLGKWQTQKRNDPISDIESNLQFESGHWWLNIACAQRDGIVTSPKEKPTKGRYGITALPLLTGREELLRNDGLNLVKYIRQGLSSDMHIPLISQVGRQIRLLRGYRLKSMYAPEAGVRYDGLYTIRQYGTKLDIITNVYKLELTLERVPDQKGMDLLRRIPTPSQLDDWNLYEKLEGDKIRLMEGDARYLEWSLQRENEKIDRAEYKRDREFRALFS